MNRSYLTGVLSVLLGLTLAACEPKAKGSESEGKADKSVASMMVDSVNYRIDRGMQYTLYDISGGKKTPVGGSIVGLLESGGAKGCCLALPKEWRPSLMVRVEWEESDFDRTYSERYAKDLEIPRYDEPSDLYVVFYPEHEVEVVVSFGEPGDSSWQGRIKETPWNHCVAEFGRKECKRVLPKLFDAVSAQGFCVFLKEEGSPEDQQLCQSATRGCMQDYEDEEFCRKVLWGPRRKKEEIMGVQ